jgi:sphinganine-1-phosphate aldolase
VLTTVLGMALPQTGRSHDEVMAALADFRKRDVRWKDGRAFSLTYYAGPEAYQVGLDAYAAFASENLLNADAFPSLRIMQTDVISCVAELLGGDADTVGVFTSGGTESILTAVKGARNWGRGRGVSNPEMILPSTAHAAFSKAADYFGVRTIRVPVRADYRADPDAMAALVTPDTVMIVGSAPAYPQGVIDPISELGNVAQEFDVLFHVDACMGFTMPWLERLGHVGGQVGSAWNFSVPGVTSMSCDLHKFGYTQKGASVLLHRSKDLRKHQFFLTNDWLGGLYGSPAILGTRGAGSLAAAWAVMQHLGQDGYLRVTAAAFDACRRIEAGLAGIDGLAIRGTPETTLVAFGADLALPLGDQIDMYAVGDRLWSNGGWFCDRQTPPDSLHCTVNAVHSTVVDEFVGAVAEAVDFVRGSTDRVAGDRTKAYSTIE